MLSLVAAVVALALGVVGLALASKTKRPWWVRVASLAAVTLAILLQGDRLAVWAIEAYVDWKAPAYHAVDPALVRFGFEVVVEDLEAPVHVTHAGDGSGRLFVVEQWGTVRVVRDGGLLEAPFCDLSEEVAAGGECGLLSIAFHPSYAQNGRAFVNFTRKNRYLETVVAELKVSRDPDRAEPGYRELLVLTQPYGNHNGGLVAFGPDGFLYVGTGDGGSANDPLGSGQDTRTLLGKLLRLDVDGTQPYAIPADNPFADGKGGLPEIYAWGLRNPWRFSWDPQQPERLFVGDVGQNTWEEVHLVGRGDNCGWNLREGLHPFVEGVAAGPLVDPIHEYGHDVGYSITGGHVYRGKELPDLQGTYVFGDYAPGPLWGLREVEGEWVSEILGEHLFRLSSFGVDEQQELYACDREDGRLLKLVSAR